MYNLFKEVQEINTIKVHLRLSYESNNIQLF